MTPNTVHRDKPNAVRAIFGRPKVVIGVVHLEPLPGSPSYEGAPLDALIDHAVREAEAYVGGGVHGLIVENHGDIPFAKPDALGPETAATMAVLTDRVRRAVPVPVGVNVLANGALHALAVAQAGQGAFVRVNQWANAYVANEGWIEGPAAAATRYRSWLRARGIRVFADVHVKHGSHAVVADRSLAELTRDAEFFDADAVIATGSRTGDATDLEELRGIAEATTLPVLVGSGVTEGNAAELLDVADGLIVASALKEDGVWWTPVSKAKTASLIRTLAPVLHDER